MMGEIAAVAVPEAGTTLMRKMLSASNPDEGLVVVPVRPDKTVSQRRTIHLTVLEALGKDKSVAEKAWGRRSHITQQTVAWLIAHRIRDLVFVHSEWLNPPLIADLILVAAQVPLHLTLVMSPGPTEPQVLALADWCLPQDSPSLPAALARALSESATTRDPGHVEFDGPLPASDPFTFLPTCERLLPSHQFTQVRDWYGGYVAWAAEHCPLDDAMGEIAEWLWQSMFLVGRSNTELLVFLRAVELVLAERNVVLRLDLARLAASSSERPTRLNTDPAWRVIRGYRFPERAAAVMLSQVGLKPQDMIALRVSDVTTPDATSLKVDRAPVELPERAAVHLRALMAQHAQLGSRVTSPLLAGPSGPLDLNEIAWLVSRGGHEKNLTASNSRALRNRHVTVRAQLRKYGIFLLDRR